MADDSKNPLGMIPDPYAGDTFVMPETLCTDQRRLWFRRNNGIIAFQMITGLAIKECKGKYEQFVIQGRLKPNTPLKIESSDGRSIIFPVHVFLKQCSDGTDILCRQVYLMLYGSLETYLFELLERSFLELDQKEKILDLSLEIMMRRNWDGKLCKMSDIFGLNYKAADMMKHFKNFEMIFEGKSFKSPLLLLDEMAQIRHKIVHASSILEKGKLIFVQASVFQGYYAFCALLTDYVDDLFAKRFGYKREKILPASA